MVILDWIALNLLFPIVLLVAAQVASAASLAGSHLFAIVVAALSVWIPLRFEVSPWWIGSLALGQFAGMLLASPLMASAKDREAAGATAEAVGKSLRFCAVAASIVASAIYNPLVGAALWSLALTLRPANYWLLFQVANLTAKKATQIFHGGPFNGQQLIGEPSGAFRTEGTLEGRSGWIVYKPADSPPREVEGQRVFDMVYAGFEPKH